MPLSEVAVIILAGGKGSRMNASAPKQFLTIKEKPLMFFPIQTFAAALPEAAIKVVLPEDGLKDFQNKVMPLFDASTKKRISTVIGGETRFQSVKNALKELKKRSKWVAIHDAARPFTSQKLIHQGIKVAQKSAGAVPTLALSDSIMQKQKRWTHQNRANFRLIQTPQIFDLAQISTAYQQPFQETFTDCASVFAAAGFKFEIFPGEKQNFKVTTPFDLSLARFWVQNIEN